MDYEKKYKQLHTFISDLYPYMSKYCQEKVEDFFPELKVGEDERIIKEILSIVKSYRENCITEGNHRFDDCIAWLEKQGESKEKPTKDQVWNYCSKISSEWWQITMNKWKTLTDEEKGEYNQYIGFNDFSDMLMNITAGALFQLIDTGKLEYEEGSLLLEKLDDTPKPLEVINEKQDEQKPVESKFKIGDWVVYEAEAWREVLQIETIDEHYTFTNGLSSSFDEEQYMRLWTIEDAKDGDVLYSHGHNLLWIYKDKNTYHVATNLNYTHNSIDGDIVIPSDVCPATKEQRDLLFNKMHEAGYEWNADEKTLVMIGFDNDDEDERYEELMKDDEMDLKIKQKPAKRSDKEFDDFFNLVLLFR